MKRVWGVGNFSTLPAVSGIGPSGQLRRRGYSSRMKMRMVYGWLLAAVAVAGCGSDPKPVSLYDGRCMGMADDLKSLRMGDELPRVIQVLGMPQKSYRVGFFGPRADVLEYDVGDGPCGRTMLGATESKVYLHFNGEGRYDGQRNSITAWGSVTPLSIDPVVLWP